MPSSSELLAGRHPLRSDLNQLSQSLSFSGWLNFCAAFNVSAGSSASSGRENLTNAALATVFYSAIARETCDDVGGLTFEEFLEVRAGYMRSLDAGAAVGKLEGRHKRTEYSGHFFCFDNVFGM